MGVAFLESLGKHPGTGEVSRVVIFQGETVGSAGKIYDVIIFPDGGEVRWVNSRDVDAFPDSRTARELDRLAGRLKPLAVELLNMEHDAAYRSAWWNLREATGGV